MSADRWSDEECERLIEFVNDDGNWALLRKQFAKERKYERNKILRAATRLLGKDISDLIRDAVDD